jgi:hypoxanthine-DNA glycosylase
MAEIVRNRTIRPSTRLEKSRSYKIDTKNVTRSDTLIVNIDHESKTFKKNYRFKGADIANKDSISFRVVDYGTNIDISWSGAQPIGAIKNVILRSQPAIEQNKKPQAIKPALSIKPEKLKQSFDPISNSKTKVLILGTMPGDKSLELGEYYGHPRNRFWKIIASITYNNMPTTYSDKKELLLKAGIGIWDVAHKASRKGSLDIAIVNEEPNDIDNFITRHKNLKVIGFNGTKAEELFDKYFSRKVNLKYISQPSTSPANTGIDFENICRIWKQILDK